MDKSPPASGPLWLPYILMLLLMAIGVSGVPKGTTVTRPGTTEGGLSQAKAGGQTIQARLWQDPFEATETVRQGLSGSDLQSPAMIAALRDSIPIKDFIWLHTTKDAVHLPNGTSDYLDPKGKNKVLFLFVSLPSESYPEAGEQRIRSRVAVVSALSTAGYRPERSGRLGVAVWDNDPDASVTSQKAYPFEVFTFDSERRVLFPTEKLTRQYDDVIVLYVEENSLPPELQFEWLKRLSRLLAENSPPERFTQRRWVTAYWLGPLTSDRMVALLRAAALAYKQGATDLQPKPEQALPITIVATRPTIEPSFVTKIVKSGLLDDAKTAAPAVEQQPPGPQGQFAFGLEKTPLSIPITQRDGGQKHWLPWITLERRGCDDGLLAQVLAHELALRRPALFRSGSHKGTVALVSEWDTLYGRALPQSFRNKFVEAGGSDEVLRYYTYLRGLDGQISGTLEKPKAEGETAKSPDAIDLFRQLQKSNAPSIAYGRTQVDYVDRLAAYLQAYQTAHPDHHLEAVGILGSDNYDKVLILQGFRKVFPSVNYFTTDLDASLFAPEQYDVTRNLLLATGFQLQLYEKYQHSILPFRDSGQSALYFATLRATEYFMMKQNQEPTGGNALDAWIPAVVEIARSGPYLLKSAIPAGSAAPGVSAEGRSALPETLESARAGWRYWLVPLVALIIIAATGLTQFGRLAVRHAISTIRVIGHQFVPPPWRTSRALALRQLAHLITRDVATWLLVLGAMVFFIVAAIIPWIALLPDQEPFFLAQGISSWPATWLRAFGIFLCACYFWIITWQFRRALANGQRELKQEAPEGCPPPELPCRPTPCEAWDRFRIRSRGSTLKWVIVGIWITYVLVSFVLFQHMDRPANVTRGHLSFLCEKGVLLGIALTMNLLIVYAITHNLSCSFFVRQTAEWLRSPDAPEADAQPLHTALMRTIGTVAGVMTQMIYYPFTLLFLLVAARQSIFDNFEWPRSLILVFSISSVALLASTLVVRRSADQARNNAIDWLTKRIADLKWHMIGAAETNPCPPVQRNLSAQAENDPAERARKAEVERAEKERAEQNQRALDRAEWQLSQIQQIGGPALSEGILSNPILRAVLIPLGGTGVLQLIDVFGKM